MHHETVSIEADFILLGDSQLGTGFIAHMLQRHLTESQYAKCIAHCVPEEGIKDLGMFDAEPTRSSWVITENSDINDAWGQGIQIRTGPLHFVLEYPVMMVALLEFIREWGVTDETCRWRMVYDRIENAGAINPLELLILLDEEKQMETWGRYGGFQRKSLVEHMRAELRTNLYWHDNFGDWWASPEKHMAYDRGYTIDLLGFKETGRMAFDIVQGHHYEHRQNEMAHLAMDINEALRLAASHSARHDTTMMASAFYTHNTRQKHHEARWKPPMD